LNNKYICIKKFETMNSREFKDAMYGDISRVTKAISNTHRLEIIDFISNGKKCVEDIAKQANLTIANASQHLQSLKKERLVKSEKDGNFVFYSLYSNEVYEVWKSLRDLTFSISPWARETIARREASPDYNKPLTFEQLSKTSEIILLDVRPEDEYCNDHIPHSISIPIAQLCDRLDELPRNKTIVAYCRGVFCSFADEAVNLLVSNGYMAEKLEDSVLDYKIKLKKNAC